MEPREKNVLEHIAELTKYTDSWLQKMVAKYQFLKDEDFLRESTWIHSADILKT